MDKAHIETLIQETVDGVISADDERLLATALADDPEARQTLEDYRKLAGIVENMPSQPAPKGFAERVMASLPRKTAPAPVRPSFSRTLAGFFAAPQLRLVYAALAGAVVAAAVTFSVIKPIPVGIDGLAATMGAAPEAIVSVQAGASELSLAAARMDGVIGLSMSVDAAAAGAIAFDAGRFHIKDIRYQDGEVSRLQVEDGTISFQTDGASRLVVHLGGAISEAATFSIEAGTASDTLELPANE